MTCTCGMTAMTELEWLIPALNSEAAAERLRETLEGIAAVRGVRVRTKDQMVLIGFDETLTSPDYLKHAIKMAGFPRVLDRGEMYRLALFGAA